VVKKEDKKEKKEEAKKKPEPAVIPEFRDAITAVLFTPDGKQLVSVGFDKYLRVWSVAWPRRNL
jgi:hypothetical protein